jgi:IS30 family transposase
VFLSADCSEAGPSALDDQPRGTAAWWELFSLFLSSQEGSPWQRGTNENTNGLLRQYFPKGADMSGYSQAYLDKIALRLTQRPRKTLGFKTPADKLGASVASTN